MIVRFVANVVLWTAVFVAVWMPGEPARAEHSSHHIVGAGWTFRWDVTATDGLAVSNAYYHGRSVIQRVTVPQCVVRYFYGTPTMKDQLGTSGNIDYVGGSVTLDRASDRISVSAKFRCCGYPAANAYQYKVKYTFYGNGDWVPTVYAYGPGIESRARYECHIRADLDLGDGTDWFEYYDGGWRRPSQEGSSRDDGRSDDHGNEWRNYDRAGWGYGIDPRPADDDPTMYVLRSNSGEGGGDLSSYTLPSKFNGTQAVQGLDHVDWYWPRTLYRRPSNCPGSGCSDHPIAIGPYFERLQRVIR